MMDLHCAYHQEPTHETNHCTTLRHAIQDLINQGLVHLGQPSVTTNPLSTHTTHTVPPPASDIHFIDFVELDDHIHILSWDESEPEPILSDGAPGAFTSTLAAPSFPNYMSLMTLYFPDEVDKHETFAEIGDMVDGAIPHDEYIDEMLTMIVEEIYTTIVMEFSYDVIVVDDLFEGTTGPVEGVSNFVDPPLSFDVLSGFVSHDDSSSTFDPGPIDQRVSPATGDTMVVDFGKGGDSEAAQCRIFISGRVSQVVVQCRPYSPKNGNVRVCVDFRDFNKASPKDDFPFPHIDMLIDSMAGHSMLYFMDGFFGYNQILRALEDMEKTSFITEWDDMIMKSRDRADHLAALERFFERIKQFRLRLNPKKCTFEVTYGKLMGYMVNERGREADLDKIKVILDMPAPRTEKEIRGFLGILQYISRFIARLVDLYKPIFRLLKKSQPTVWDDQCQCTFERIKEYLLSPLVLVLPTPGRHLLLYLSVSDVASGCMLAQLDDSGNERTIYYLSKRMLDYKTRYVMIEHFYLALVWVTRRLRHYMTEYSVHLISRLDHLRYLFDRPTLVGRLMRWLILLTEFDIHYVTQKSIRWSIVANHFASLPVFDGRVIDDDFPDEDVAIVISLSGCIYFDGATNHSRYGIGVLLISPHGDHILRSVRLAFSDQHPATNNIVEYEA
ncbi:Retrovirus-related Pol polyprotein from transposon 297 [Vitis vinifera]|uniref:Retrovirus-related Pol polyprotein from transposon 297 n=1 Tax=Vitis vinifera TaxID=29760 RepID=A0A438JGI0_VITVI|nr:Retrovirus-related Pol polyprotein from transposon 297 [Vitis vinifera]